jgi:hypothetical protein
MQSKMKGGYYYQKRVIRKGLSERVNDDPRTCSWGETRHRARNIYLIPPTYGTKKPPHFKSILCPDLLPRQLNVTQEGESNLFEAMLDCLRAALLI